MRRIASILSILMLLQAAQPFAASDPMHSMVKDMHSTGMESKCCSKKKVDGNKECNGSGQCNSIAACCRLQYVVASHFFYKAPAVQIKKTNPGYTCYKIESGYTLSSWHPPELT